MCPNAKPCLNRNNDTAQADPGVALYRRATGVARSRKPKADPLRTHNDGVHVDRALAL